jgi:hypothetical protein
MVLNGYEEEQFGSWSGTFDLCQVVPGASVDYTDWDFAWFSSVILN